MTSIEIFSKKHEGTIIAIVVLLAVLRVFVFAAAFPFFSNIDEESHYDMIVKYSKGYSPVAKNVLFEKESAVNIIVNDSPEYEVPPEYFPEAKIPDPAWTKLEKNGTEFVIDPVTMDKAMEFTNDKNPFAKSPFLYYFVAGKWFGLGKSLGISSTHLLYWTRFLNSFFYGVFVFIVWLTARLYFKQNMAICISVPLLAAFVPQDVFYSLNSDVLGVVLFSISFYMLSLLYLDSRGRFLSFITGIFIFLALLSKVVNLILLPLALVFMILSFWKNGLNLKELKRLVPFLAGFAIPFTIYAVILNSYSVIPFSANYKIEILGWTRKPFLLMFDHPVFSLSGMFLFLNNLTKGLFRGELYWAGEQLTSGSMDRFYLITSFLFIGLSLFALKTSFRNKEKQQVIGVSLALLVVLAFYAFLGLLSIMYDFKGCWYPSPEYPYFTSGRIIFGCIGQFLTLYMIGLCFIVAKIKSINISPILCACAISIGMLINEILLSLSVFTSAYNWFH